MSGGGGVMEAVAHASSPNLHSASPLAAWVVSGLMQGRGAGGLPAVRHALGDAEGEMLALVGLWEAAGGSHGDLRKGGPDLVLGMSPEEILVAQKVVRARTATSGVRRRDRSRGESPLQWLRQSRDRKRLAVPPPPAAISLGNAAKGRYGTIWELLDGAGLRCEGYAKMSSVLHRLGALRLRSVAPSDLKPLVRSVCDADGIVDLAQLPLALSWHGISHAELPTPNEPQLEKLHLAPVVVHTTGPQERVPTSGINLIDQFAPLVYDTRALDKKVAGLTHKIVTHKSAIAKHQDEAAAKMGFGGPRAPAPPEFDLTNAEMKLLSNGWDKSTANLPRRVEEVVRPPSSAEKQLRALRLVKARQEKSNKAFADEVEKFARGDKVAAVFGRTVYRREHVEAAIKIQKLMKGVLQRIKVRAAFRHVILSAMSLDEYSKKKTSEINHMFRTIAGCDIIHGVIKQEAKMVSDVLEAMQATEEVFCEKADAEAALQFDELQQAEAEAGKQVAEAREAEVKMEREREEMLAWQAKAARYQAAFEQALVKRPGAANMDHALLKMEYPELWREKNQLSGIQMRADKEKQQYEESMASLNKERDEARDALREAARERGEWQQARHDALKERQQVEAFALARKFTDPQVSVKERLRARSKTSTEAPRIVRKMYNTTTGKDYYLGAIRAVDGSSFTGDFIVVMDEEKEALLEAFNSAVPPDAEEEALDLPALQQAMFNIGRRLNLNEAERLIKSFDTDGGGTVDFDEFAAGFERMVGMELPHGLGVERLWNGARYEGELYEDKRSGIGMLTAPSGHFFLGPWNMGARHGRGIEGEVRIRDGKNAVIPIAIVQCSQGVRTSVDRFDVLNKAHRKLFRSMCLVVDAAKKREQKARSIIAPGLRMTTLPKRPCKTLVAVPPPLHLTGPNVRPQGMRHTLVVQQLQHTPTPITPVDGHEIMISSASQEVRWREADSSSTESPYEQQYGSLATGSKRGSSQWGGSHEDWMNSRPATGDVSEGGYRSMSREGVSLATPTSTSSKTEAWSLSKEQINNLMILQNMHSKTAMNAANSSSSRKLFADAPDALYEDAIHESPNDAGTLKVGAWRGQLPPIATPKKIDVNEMTWPQ